MRGRKCERGSKCQRENKSKCYQGGHHELQVKPVLFCCRFSEEQYVLFCLSTTQPGSGRRIYPLASFLPWTKLFSVGHVKVICMLHGFVSLGVTGTTEGRGGTSGWTWDKVTLSCAYCLGYHLAEPRQYCCSS